MLLTNKFSFAGKIESDGFAASNQLAAKHLNELAGQIDSNLKRLDLCQ